MLVLNKTSIRLLTKNNTKSVQHNLEKHIKIHNKTVSKALENYGVTTTFYHIFFQFGD